MVKNTFLVNRGLLYKGSTAVHLYMGGGGGPTQLFIFLGSNCKIGMSSTELVLIQYYYQLKCLYFL